MSETFYYDSFEKILDFKNHLMEETNQTLTPANPPWPQPSHSKTSLLKKRCLRGRVQAFTGKPLRDESADPGRAGDDPYSRSFPLAWARTK